MSDLCPKCGSRTKNDALFCPNCGFKLEVKSEEVSYEALIKDIIYVDGRLSKAKLIGVAIFLIYIFGTIIFAVPNQLRYGFLPFFFAIFAAFIAGLIYYCICRGIGFIVRKFTSK